MTLDANVRLIVEGSGEPLVLLHCLGVDHRFWDFAKPLAQHFKLIRYDLPGHGAAAMPNGPYTIWDLADQLATVMRANNLTRAHVGGISLGGLIAQDFAARYPQMVSKLILVDTTPRYTDAMREMWAERAETARTKGVAAMVDALLSVWFSKTAIAQDGAGLRYVRDTLASCNGEAYALACEALAEADLREALSSIAAKTLVICGDDDIPSFLDAARLLGDAIPGAKLEWIPNTRHASVLESPDSAILMMKQFLQS